jgi:hypothetical protein
MAAFVASGAALLVAQWNGRWVVWPDNPWNGRPVTHEIEQTRQALALGRPVPSGPGDEAAFVESVVARRLFGKELRFDVSGSTCTVDLALSGLDAPLSVRTKARLIDLGPDSVFVCPP